MSQSIQEVKVTQSFDRVPFIESLEALAQQQPIRLFYPIEGAPQKLIDDQFKQVDLSTCLDQILEGTNWSYFYYNNQAVILGPKSIIEEKFTPEYYTIREAQRAVDQTPNTTTIGTIETLSSDGTALIKGTITDAASDEPIIGAAIKWDDNGTGITTDIDGTFTITLPADQYNFQIQYIGYEPLEQSVQIIGGGSINLRLERAAIELQQIIVSADAPDANVSSAQIGVTKIDLKSLEKLPSFLGEVDIIKGLLLQPGVSNIGEGAAGFNVRGGDIDQNLVLLDDAMLFNTNHALGFFSTINPDLIKSVTLFKGNVPATQGGRLASSLEIELKDGDMEHFHLKGGVGPVSSRLTIDGPIVKNKMSFLGSFRSSYANWLLKAVNVPEVQQSKTFFYDTNLRLTSRLNDKNTLTFAGYLTEDDFSYNEAFGFNYQTGLGQVIWKSFLNKKWYNRFTLSASQYQSRQEDLDGSDASKLYNEVNYYKFHNYVTFSPNDHMQWEGGVTSTWYNISPGQLEPTGQLSVVEARTIEQEQALESALYAQLTYNLSQRWMTTIGLRGSAFHLVGPYQQGIYKEGESLRNSNRFDLRQFASNKIVVDFWNLEPSLSFRYHLSNRSSIKGGYRRMVQYLNQISNTNTPTPSSQWQLSTPHIAPKKAHNISIGYFQNFNENNIESAVEVYYRHIDQLYDFIDFAELVANPFIETQLANGTGRAYGLEARLYKKQGAVNGTIGYTLSRTEQQVIGINQGAWYPSQIDQPHNFVAAINFQPNQRNTLAINFTYASGRPTTAPLAAYREYNSFVAPVFSLRNQYRIPDYHRLDFAYTIGQGYRKDKKVKTSWTFSLYNVYGRKNAFNIFFIQEPFQSPKAYRLAVLGSIFPALTFNLETL